MAAQPRHSEDPRPTPADRRSIGEGRWLARLLVTGLSIDWTAFSTDELNLAETLLVDEQHRLNARGIDCTDASVSVARVELARERTRRLHVL